MKSTREVSNELKISPAALRAHIASGNIQEPARRIGLSFVWIEPEIEAARKALALPGRRRSHWFRKATAELTKREIETCTA